MTACKGSKRRERGGGQPTPRPHTKTALRGKGKGKAMRFNLNSVVEDGEFAKVIENDGVCVVFFTSAVTFEDYKKVVDCVMDSDTTKEFLENYFGQVAYKISKPVNVIKKLNSRGELEYMICMTTENKPSQISIY